MPIQHTIDPRREHAVIAGSGRLSMTGMIAAVEEVPRDPLFASHFSVILDLREAEYSAELSDGDTLAAVLKQRKTDFQGKFAVVVPPALHFLAKLYCTLTQMGGFDRIQCFTDIAEARQWCGVENVRET